MENLKKNKMFIIIISVLIIIVAVLGIMLIKNNDGRGNKVGSSDKNEKNIKIVEKDGSIALAYAAISSNFL